MDRRRFLKWTGLGIGLSVLPTQTWAHPASGLRPVLPPGRRMERPNILYIFADDQCFEAIHAVGCEEIETPNLDRLVKWGVRFTHAYNMGSWTGAVCVASRTMLNTGRWLWNARAVDRSLAGEAQAGRLWSQMMRAAGYETYFTGKWHVKIKPEQIFDNVTHVRPGMPNQTPQGYNRPIEGQPDPWKPWDTQFGGYWKGGKHWSEVLGDDATAFLQQASRRNKPFFMYLAFNAPHDPRQSPKEYVDKYPQEKVKVPSNFLAEYPYKDAIGCGQKLRDERLAPFPRTEYAVKVHRQEYYAIITHMDAQVGRILDALEATGKADETYIFFTADHGLACGHHGLMGKQNMHDPSMRVPLMVCGPGIEPGRQIDTPVYLQDIMPTTLELAGVTPPEHVEFRSLLGLMEGRETEHYPYIYGAYLNLQRMVFDGRFKLIYYPAIDKALLYDMKVDPLEMHDLAAQPRYAGQVRRLRRLLAQAMKAANDPLVAAK